MPKRKNEHIKLGNAIGEFLEHNKLVAGIDGVEVRIAWKEVMGQGVSQYTRSVDLRGDTLYVNLTSSVLREELSYGKSKIIANLNEHLNKELIKTLVIR